MIIDDDAKLYLYEDLRLTVDPTGSTVELEVGATRYPMTWQGTPTQVITAAGTVWTQTARTVSKFIGSATTPAGNDVQLPAGSYSCQAIVTPTDTQVIPGPTDTLQVR